MKKLWVLIGLLSTGCASFTPPSPDDPFYAPVIPEVAEVAPNTNGAIYNPGNAVFLLDERKARRVGDLITINLVEKTQAQTKADTKLQKDTEVSNQGPTLFGRPVTIGGTEIFEMGGSTERQFDAKAESKQNNALTGTITAHVAQVLPNGNLVIRGEKWVQVNRGNEFIRLSGIVRPEDISADNTIASSRVGNARIAYSGTGEVAESNQQGWLARFFSSPWWPL